MGFGLRSMSQISWVRWKEVVNWVIVIGPKIKFEPKGLLVWT